MAVTAIGDAAAPDDVLAAMFARGRGIALAANQTLFRAGASGDGCYRLESGLLKVTLESPQRGERIIAILGPGSLVGDLSMLDGAPRSASVAAVRESKLCFVSSAEFLDFAQARPEIYRAMTMMLARRLRAIDGAVTAASFLSLKGRVAHALLVLSDAFGKNVGQGRILINQKISQRDLASMAGIARENLSRILQDFMRRALVSRMAGYYCLEKPSGLTQEATLDAAGATNTAAPSELGGD
jgi:CRP/FNR family transcriptional regulator, cyclic AMP receptor protein